MTSLPAAPARDPAQARPVPEAHLELCCWCCATALSPLVANPRAACVCPQCSNVTFWRDGIFHALSPASARGFERFIAEYQCIRASEGRGSLDPGFYLALPFAASAANLSGQWRIRARTFEHFVRHILNPLAAQAQRPLKVLDLGAGNGWLSYRLSQMGHHPVAVDLLTNDRDGLGAARHYTGHLPHMFPRVRADLNCLPFPSSSFDLAVFNASFHYSEDFASTLGEALRCVRFGAPVVIADTPWYREERGGLEMVAEKHAHFLKTYGFPSDALESQEFLTPERLDALARELNVQWRVLKPWYGLGWAMRPLLARLRGRRVPSKFRIFVAERMQ